jgi:hypothetical protein
VDNDFIHILARLSLAFARLSLGVFIEKLDISITYR